MLMICPSCGADLPADARFCIECGTALAQPATDVTIKLPASQPAMLCRNCGAPNPADAIFCVRCGRRHSELARSRLRPLPPVGRGAARAVVAWRRRSS
jgi:ribosomal protein L40E